MTMQELNKNELNELYIINKRKLNSLCVEKSHYQQKLESLKSSEELDFCAFAIGQIKSDFINTAKEQVQILSFLSNQ